jgi:hypothetical protein
MTVLLTLAGHSYFRVNALSEPRIEGFSIESFASAAVVALIAAFAAAFLATRRAKGETRWKAKYDAYARVLSSVEDIRFWAEETYASNLLLPTVGAEQLRLATQRYDEAKRVLWSYVHVGALVVCPEARSKLEALLSAIGREEHRFQEDMIGDDDYSGEIADHCDRIRKIVADQIPAVMTIAQHDLG